MLIHIKSLFIGLSITAIIFLAMTVFTKVFIFVMLGFGSYMLGRGIIALLNWE